MANELVGLCWLIQFPSPAMRLVMMKLADCAEPDGTSVYPSVTTIARETDLSCAAVSKWLKAARECGLIDDETDLRGNRPGRTTKIREINTTAMRLLAGQRVRGRGVIPSSHIFAEIEAAEAVPDAAGGETRITTRWAIIPRPQSDAVDATSEITNVAGTPPCGGEAENAAPLRGGGVPLHEVGATPPPGGVCPSTTWEQPFIGTVLDPSPNPSGAGGQKAIDEDRQEQDDAGEGNARLIDGLVAWGRHRHVVDRLLKPLLAQRRFSAKGALVALQDIAASCADFTPDKLDRVLELVLDGPATVKAARVTKAIADVKKYGLMLPISQDKTPELWAAWLAYFDAIGSNEAPLMRRFTRWSVSAKQPPALPSVPSATATPTAVGPVLDQGSAIASSREGPGPDQGCEPGSTQASPPIGTGAARVAEGVRVRDHQGPKP